MISTGGVESRTAASRRSLPPMRLLLVLFVLLLICTQYAPGAAAHGHDEADEMPTNDNGNVRPQIMHQELTDGVASAPAVVVPEAKGQAMADAAVSITHEVTNQHGSDEHVIGHGEDEHQHHHHGHDHMEHHMSENKTPSQPHEQTYFTHKEHSGLILAHIALMCLAWIVVLPAVMFMSVIQSRLSTLLQFIFLGTHCAGLFFGAIYSLRTPDLYKNNAHSKMGWIFTWVIIAQTVLNVIRLVANRRGDAKLGHAGPHADMMGSRSEERESFLQQVTNSPSSAAMMEPSDESGEMGVPFQDHMDRYPADNRPIYPIEPPRSGSMSSTATFTQDEQQLRNQYRATDDSNHYHQHNSPMFEKPSAFGNAKLNRLANGAVARMSARTVRGCQVVLELIDRLSLVIGFIAIISGAVVYGGVFKERHIFNGVAHTIKGGIFFWYGLATLGRWIGCFAEWGWSWNLRPPVGVVTRRQARMPSAEFCESFIIWLYGASNVFLEHLNAWGKAWSPMDLEHISITIMFFGGGLCGMLVDSSRVRNLLNVNLLTSPALLAMNNNASNNDRGRVGTTTSSQQQRSQLAEARCEPKSYALPLNPLPAIVLTLLGLIMSSHHQNSIVSTALHKQWGNLLVGASLARLLTYALCYIRPPTSYFPSRPPTELICSFCFIAGGIIFMASNKDTVAALETHGIHAAFPFTVTMGLTALIMAWVLCLFTFKGWIVRRMRRGQAS